MNDFEPYRPPPMDPPELARLEGWAYVFVVEPEWAGAIFDDGNEGGLYIVVPDWAEGSTDLLAAAALVDEDMGDIKVVLRDLYDTGVGGYQCERVEVVDGINPW